LALFLGFVGGFAGSFVGKSQIAHDVFFIENSEMISAVDAVSDSVVSILAYTNSGQKETGGTGFLVDESGIILTNRHVVEDLSLNYVVVFNDGEQAKARVLSLDPFDDVAAIKVESDREFKVAKFGDSDVLQVGQQVLAIGNALAQYENTASSGIISAIGRDVTAFNDFGYGVENLSGLLQTDASINLGSSGGPLINMQGQVIAMNVAVASSANGIGFAIPINDLKPIVKSLVKNGEIIRPVLGVRFLMLSKSQASEFSKDLVGGALVVGDGSLKNPAVIYKGAAFDAGVKEKDIILSIDDIDLSVDMPLQKVIREHVPGDRVKMKIWRNGKVQYLDVVLKSNKDLED